MSVDRFSRRRALMGLRSSASVAVSVTATSYWSGSARRKVGASRPATRWRSRSTATASGSRSKQRIESQSQRLYAADGEITAAGVDNTTRDRASNPRGVSDRDPIENRAHQGFAYGQRDRYWLAVDQPGESLPAGTEAFEQRVVYPGSARDDRVVCSSTPTANRRRREPTAIDRRH